ncbi:tetratricopeptide repeat protein [Crenobacter luteus]|uniref:cellulose synthase subunit BcsC-related outer membrane protein n=1 Tax=Crenobacter luteus TaxID=1452487 RepID=UPI0010E4AB1D|nr:cellulose synthase subunit BcsC-related outer membrane protein [Crenobacter luteus]TCP10629.1 tetratricopeptide repeat protein [Crenobacter luteus]
MSRLAPFLILGALAAPAVHAAVDPAEALLSQARRWQSLDRHDLAQQALDKLLRIAPDHPDGLAQLALLQLRTMRRAEAAATLARLKRLHPGHQGIARVEQQHRLLAGADQSRLLAARALARSGKVDAAIAAFDALYRGRPPEGEMALEYWRLVARSERNGWARAHAGLSALVRDFPDNRRYRLALAELYLDKPPAPAKLFAELKTLSVHPDSRSQALGVWRRALLQERLDSMQRGAFVAYLREVPDDDAVKDHLAALEGEAAKLRALLADPAYRARLDAAALLDQNRLAEAEAKLDRARTRYGGEPDVLGGYGRLREKQGRYDEAIDLYRQAAAKDSDKAAWQARIANARLARQLQLAERAEAAGELDKAWAMLAEAARIKPRSVDLKVAEGRLLARRGERSGASAAYRTALKMDPGSGAALAGLVELSLAAGGAEEAERLLSSLAPARRKAFGRAYAAAQARVERERAERLLAAGRHEEAIAALQRAVAAEPQDPWHRFALANAHVAAGEAVRGERLLRELADAPGADGEALYAYALFGARIGQDRAALDALQRVAPVQRSDGMQALQRRLWLRETLRLASAELAAGRPARAGQRLDEAERQLAGDAEAMAGLARGWLALGRPERALALSARLSTSQPTPASTLRHADLLLDMDRDDEVRALLARLPAEGLAREDAEARAGLLAALAARKAERLYRDGDQDGARVVLETALAEAPNDARLLRELAAIDIAQARWPDAASRLDAAQRRAPGDDEVRLLRVDLDRLSGRLEAARSGIEQLLAEAPGRSVDFRLRVIDRLEAMGEADAARAALVRLAGAAAPTPRLWAYAARQARRDNLPDLALRRYRNGLASAPAATPFGEVPLASRPWSMLPGGAAVAADAGDALPSLGAGPLLPVASETADRVALHEAYAELLDRRTGGVQTGIELTGRKSGTAGQSSLRMAQAPLVVTIPARDEGRVFLRAEPVTMSVGTLSPDDGYSRDRFGSILLCGDEAARRACAARAGEQRATGVAFGVGYENVRWRADVGTTPIGFAVEDVVGGVRYSGDLGQLYYSVDASRRPLTSSVLTYAGTTDPASGQTWGGVRATGAAFGLGYDRGGAFGVWSNFGYHWLDGRNVKDNDRLTAMAGIYWRVVDAPTARMTVGLNSINFWFRENLSEFTLGHGGYYSPQRYNSLSLPVSYAGRGERLSYVLRGSVSVSNSREKDAPFFPNDPERQRAAGNPVYAGSSGWGSGASLGGLFEYQLAPKWVLGGRVELDYSEFYQPGRVGLYLRYSFAPPASPLPFPPEPLQPYSSF